MCSAMQEFLEANGIGRSGDAALQKESRQCAAQSAEGGWSVLPSWNLVCGAHHSFQPAKQMLWVRWRILAHALGLNLDMTSFTLVVY